MFDSFVTQMQIMSAIVITISIAFFAAIIYRILKGRSIEPLETVPTVIKEKEIIREIVKIRCPYCNTLYNEAEDACPNCGAKTS